MINLTLITKENAHSLDLFLKRELTDIEKHLMGMISQLAKENEELDDEVASITTDEEGKHDRAYNDGRDEGRQEALKEAIDAFNKMGRIETIKEAIKVIENI